MRRVFMIGMLVLAFGTASGLTGRAQGRAEEIDSVKVTASRVPVALHSSARIVTLLDSVAIASAPAETVNDLLKYTLGVDVRQRGAMGMQTDISIRGGTYNQVAVLLDGINITDPQTGHNSFDFPVNLCDIERIEVLEGPAARVYGTSSLLGAVNIVTRRPAGSGVSASLEGGS
ncbi:MAG: TonB-dependent receptor, partial [Bacteroidales bacterium]|nr:TonB-dependent receptor [Bacteroidales bacterium]